MRSSAVVGPGTRISRPPTLDFQHSRSSLLRCLISFLRSQPSLAGGQRRDFVHLLDRSRVRLCPSAGGAPSAPGELVAAGPEHVPVWSDPVSILGMSLFTALISTSPELS